MAVPQADGLCAALSEIKEELDQLPLQVPAWLPDLDHWQNVGKIYGVDNMERLRERMLHVETAGAEGCFDPNANCCTAKNLRRACAALSVTTKGKKLELIDRILYELHCFGGRRADQAEDLEGLFTQRSEQANHLESCIKFLGFTFTQVTVVAIQHPDGWIKGDHPDVPSRYAVQLGGGVGVGVKLLGIPHNMLRDDPPEDPMDQDEEPPQIINVGKTGDHGMLSRSERALTGAALFGQLA
jgi:hypothetical protein